MVAVSGGGGSSPAGSGYRLESLRFALTIYNGKGRKDRQTLLSSQLKEVLERQIKFGINIQCKDNKRGVGCSLPPGLSRKYPNAFKSDA